MGGSSSETPELTVLMAVYNGAEYLIEATRSVLNQDFRDFELIVVDDASTDQTPAILASLDDPRVRVLRNPENLGLTRSLNRGLREATGEFVARLDADDRCRPKRFAEQCALFREHPEVWVSGADAIIIDDAGEPQGLRKSCPAHGQMVAQMFFRNPIVHSSAMFRRKEIMGIGGYDESFGRAQDYDLWFRVVSRGGRLASLTTPYVEQRMHKGRVTILDSDEMARCRLRVLQRAFAALFGIGAGARELSVMNDLYLSGRTPKDIRRLRQVLFFRRFYAGFCKRFGSEAGAVEALKRTLVGLLWNMNKGRPRWRAISGPIVFGEGTMAALKELRTFLPDAARKIFGAVLKTRSRKALLP